MRESTGFGKPWSILVRELERTCIGFGLGLGDWEISKEMEFCLRLGAVKSRASLWASQSVGRRTTGEGTAPLRRQQALAYAELGLLGILRWV